MQVSTVVRVRSLKKANSILSVHDRLSLIPVILLLSVLHGKIGADAFLEDKLHALLSDTVTEMYKLG